MIRFLPKRRLYWQLALSFLFLFSTSTIVVIWICLVTLQSVYELSLQTDNQLLAAEVAAALQPHVTPTVDLPSLNRSLEVFQRFSPKTELYFLDKTAALLPLNGHALSKGARVDASVIERFLEDGMRRSSALLIKHPETGERQPFSAAQMTILGEPGYLLVMLSRHRFKPVQAMSLENALAMRGGGLIVLGWLISLAVGLAVFSLLTRKFYLLMKVVQGYQQGNFSERVAFKSSNELGELANALNHMAATIESNIVALEQKDSLRRELVANVAHDLRAPISGLMALAEALDMRLSELPKEKLRDYFSGMISATESLSLLIDELFEHSKYEAGEVRPNISRYSLQELLDQARVRFAAKAARQQVSLDVEMRGGDALVHCDRQMLARVFDNLIENSLRYTPAGGQILLEASMEQDDDVVVSIRDTGKGIPQDELDKVLERFYQARSGELTGRAGRGLGLSIVSQILQLHGSKLQVTSAIGEGTRFYFLLKSAAAVATIEVA